MVTQKDEMALAEVFYQRHAPDYTWLAETYLV